MEFACSLAKRLQLKTNTREIRMYLHEGAWQQFNLCLLSYRIWTCNKLYKADAFWQRWAGGLFWQVDLHDLTIRFELRLFYKPRFHFHSFSIIFIHFHWFLWKLRKPWTLTSLVVFSTSTRRSTGKGANICLKPYDRRFRKSTGTLPQVKHEETAASTWPERPDESKDCHLKAWEEHISQMRKPGNLQYDPNFHFDKISPNEKSWRSHIVCSKSAPFF